MSKKTAPTFEMLQHEYTHLMDTMDVRGSWVSAFNARAAKIAENRDRYQAVSDSLGGRIPWQFIGVIHSMESGCNFNTHLHNGDSLTARTRRVPARRPRTGSPPFTWEESAKDALTMKGLHEITDWSDERVAYELERYNGWGYRLYHKSTLSPYLWSGTNHYTRGKYVSDGKWSSSAVSQQTGAMPLYKQLSKSRAEKRKEVVKNSTKLSWAKRFRNWLVGLFGGYGIADYFNIATDYMSKLQKFAFENKYLLLIGAGATVFLLLKFFEDKSVKDYEEGRYVPSGLGENE